MKTFKNDNVVLLLPSTIKLIFVCLLLRNIKKISDNNTRSTEAIPNAVTLYMCNFDLELIGQIVYAPIAIKI